MTTYAVYYKPFSMDVETALADRETNYRLVAIQNADNIEHLFGKMQGENWSPNGEKRELIEGLGVGHTSMSEGDMAVDLSNNKSYIIQSIGWEIDEK